MEKSLEERIRHAVEEGRKVRSQYYNAIDLPDKQQLGTPASHEMIVKLETRLGKKLPASYRVFLSLYDGWLMVDGAMDLLSVEEMLKEAQGKEIRKSQTNALTEDDLVTNKDLVIGLAKVTSTKLLLNSERTNSQGEWIVVQHHNAEECTYPSFLAWLEKSVDEFSSLIRQEKKMKANN